MDGKKPETENYAAAERPAISPERRALFEKHFPRKTYNLRMSKYGTINYIQNHADPSENVLDFLNERSSLLGPQENVSGGRKGYRIKNIEKFLEVWKGEEGEKWRKEREELENEIRLERAEHSEDKEEDEKA